jgi:crotonobetainyl-CoA:carnitine CoA-transferase CaiB-like acyl-CoA transferase
MSFQADWYFHTGKVAERAGNDHPVGSPYGTFKALDGYINIAPAGQPMWERLAQALGLKDLISDPRFATNDLRREHRKELNEIINRITSQKTMKEWIDYLNREGVPCGPIYNLAQTFGDPQVKHQEMMLELEQPSVKMKVLGFPVKMSETPARIRRPSPQLGEHSEEILRNLGYSQDEIRELRGKKVI